MTLAGSLACRVALPLPVHFMCCTDLAGLSLSFL